MAPDLDPARLLSQALRAQAASVPLHQLPGVPPGQDRGPGLPPPGRRAAAGGWVLVIALVLGLLAGAVAGLVSVL